MKSLGLPEELTGKPIPTGHLGSIDYQDFPEYKLKSEALFLDGQYSGQQIIHYNGKYIATLSDRYKILPNEDVIATGQSLKQKFGLIELQTAPKDWFYIQPHQSTIFNEDKSQICMIYLSPKEYSITDDKDDSVKVGFVLRNSINGKWALSASSFTFRRICENMMFHIARYNPISGKLADGSLHEDYQGLKSDIQINDMKEHQVIALSGIYKRHTSKLDIEIIAPDIESVLSRGISLVEKYRDMSKLALQKAQAIKLFNNLPKAVMKEIDWISVDKNSKITFKEGITEWKAFNDITQKLTHNGTNFRQVMLSMRAVDKIFDTDKI